MDVSKPASGFNSSEFVATLAMVLAMATDVVPEKYAPYVAGLVALYVTCRTVLKVLHAQGYLKQVPDLPELPTSLKQTTTTETEVTK